MPSLSDLVPFHSGQVRNLETCPSAGPRSRFLGDTGVPLPEFQYHR